MIATDVATGIASVYQNTGTFASPVWTPFGTPSLGGVNVPTTSPIFCQDNGGTANGLVVTVYAVGTTAVALTTGLAVAVRIKNTFATNTASTLNFNGTTKSIKKHTNPSSNLSTAFAVGAVMQLIYTPGVGSGVWQEQSVL